MVDCISQEAHAFIQVWTLDLFLRHLGMLERLLGLSYQRLRIALLPLRYCRLCMRDCFRNVLGLGHGQRHQCDPRSKCPDRNCGVLHGHLLHVQEPAICISRWFFRCRTYSIVPGSRGYITNRISNGTGIHPSPEKTPSPIWYSGCVASASLVWEKRSGSQ